LDKDGPLAEDLKTSAGSKYFAGGDELIDDFEEAPARSSLLVRVVAFVTVPDGNIYKAVRWLSRPESDLAVIVLQAAGLPAAPVNTSWPPAPGDKIRVAGNPLAFNNIVVEGNVGRYLRINDMEGKIFSMDAPIYPGNSGSPVFDMSGRVVGVVFGTMGEGNDGSEKAAGLAVTIDEAADLIKSVKNTT